MRSEAGASMAAGNIQLVIAKLAALQFIFRPTRIKEAEVWQKIF